MQNYFLFSLQKNENRTCPSLRKTKFFSIIVKRTQPTLRNHLNRATRQISRVSINPYRDLIGTLQALYRHLTGTLQAPYRHPIKQKAQSNISPPYDNPVATFMYSYMPNMPCIVLLLCAPKSNALFQKKCSNRKSSPNPSIHPNPGSDFNAQYSFS